MHDNYESLFSASCHNLPLNDVQVGRFYGILQKNSASSVTQQCSTAAYRPVLNPRRHSARRNRWSSLPCVTATACQAKRRRKTATYSKTSHSAVLFFCIAPVCSADFATTSSTFKPMFSAKHRLESNSSSPSFFLILSHILLPTKITNPPIARSC